MFNCKYKYKIVALEKSDVTFSCLNEDSVTIVVADVFKSLPSKSVRLGKIFTGERLNEVVKAYQEQQ